MKAIRVATTNGIDDIKLVGETPLEREFIKQLAEAGTLSSMSRLVADSITFRPLSVGSTVTGSGYASTHKYLGKFDFDVIQNANHNVDLAIKKAGVPLNLSIYTTIKLQVKNTAGALIFEVSLASGLTVTGPDLNVLGVSFTALQTAKLCQDEYFYDILFGTAGSNTYYLEGKITAKHTGTR